MDRVRNILIEKELFAKKWEMDTARVAKAIILLDMIWTINDKCYNIVDMNMIVVIDNETVWWMIHRGMKVLNHYNQDAAAEAYIIEKIIQ